MKKTPKTSKADDVSMSDADAKRLVIEGVRTAMDSMQRQSLAFARIADAATLYAETFAAQVRSDEQYAKDHKKLFLELRDAVMESFNKIANPARYVPTPGDKARVDRGVRIAEKREKILVAKWDATEKSKHTDPDCSYDACVCPLFLHENGRIGPFGMGSPLYMPGGQTVAAYGRPLGGDVATGDYEVKS